MKGTKWVTIEVDEKHEKLYRSAPDLYKACKAVLAETENIMGNGNLEMLYVSKAFTKLGKALAKAEG